MKLFKHIIVTFFISLLTTFVIYGGYTLYAQDDYSDDNFRDATDFYTAFNAYHGEMNDFFNKKIKQFNMLMLDGNGDDDEAFYQNPEKKQKFLPPSNISDKDDLEAIVTKCGDENVSTYCVSMGALYKYLDYLKVLDRIKNNPDFTGGSGNSLSYIIAYYNAAQRQILLETEEAKQVLEGTVSAYNEFRLAYPMHKKYQFIIKQLTKYRLALKDIRKRVAQFPEKFIDATSDQCN